MLSLTIMVCLTPTLYGGEVLNEENKPLTFGASYIGDNFNNITGGIKTGSVYLGMANLVVLFDFQQAGLWKGAQFYINAANTQGASPSAELLGDLQVASNIEAGNHSYVQEFWLKQALGNVEITAGLQDLNVEFANSENGALFLNSSFGILPIISNNISAPIFPLTTLGLTCTLNITETIAWKNAVYDGSPADFNYNPYNLNWKFNKGDGILAITEFQKKLNIARLPGIYKIGIYSHFHSTSRVLEDSIPDLHLKSNTGVYMYADQKIWKQNDRSAGLFLQVGYSPSPQSFNSFYLGTGINFTGLLNRYGKDVAGFALAYGKFRTGCEAALEFTYQYQVTKNLFIQPDVQYIINPIGTGEALNNALGANLRFGFSF